MSNVFIALPNLSWISTALVYNLIGWVRDGAYLTMPEGLRPASFAYNHCITHFLTMDCTHLWFMNPDTIPPQDSMKRLLDADTDIVYGIWHNMMRDEDGILKRVPVSCRKNSEGGRVPLVFGEGLERIDGTGTGCTMIKREVFEAISPPWFEDRDYPGELAGDYRFCQKAIDAGFELFADYSIQCQHLKETRI